MSYQKINALIESLVKEFNYKPLSPSTSTTVREFYENNLTPEEEQLSDRLTLYTSDNKILAYNTERIVIGDYGAYYEIKPEHIVRERLENKKGQEYRFKDPRYKDKVKYFWLNPKGYPDTKIYYQKRVVSYADYKPEMIYISCFDKDVYSGYHE